ncbi:hypothetical protein ACFU67_23710 [Streptomyces rhizosphaericola]|uniref:hypothetical protein n=1 Tax=Streptomyces TaxID=1883 RepID=UPI00051662D5|nr:MULTISPECIES: hypothetical protein [unclassified Streptomyces]MYT95073.1 hypothetical protein [Streptomyces sp. SID8359]
MNVGLKQITRSQEVTVPPSNSRQPQRRTWPYAVTAVTVLAIQQGWDAQQVITLAVSLLVLIALITSAGQE